MRTTSPPSVGSKFLGIGAPAEENPGSATDLLDFKNVKHYCVLLYNSVQGLFIPKIIAC